jgi:hypothetical protein
MGRKISCCGLEFDVCIHQYIKMFIYLPWSISFTCSFDIVSELEITDDKSVPHTCIPRILFVCLRRLSNISAIQWLLSLPLTVLQYLGICLATMAYSIQRFFYVPYLLRHGTSVFRVIFEILLILSSKCRAHFTMVASQFRSKVTVNSPL